MTEVLRDWERVVDAFVTGREAESPDLRSVWRDEVATRVLLFGERPFAARLDGLRRLVFVAEGPQDPRDRTLREIVWDAALSLRLRPVMNSHLLAQIADFSDGALGAAWYERLRESWRPARVTVLVIGESAPAPGRGAPRFFYAEPLSQADNLYRAVVRAALRKDPGRAGDVKHDHLIALKSRGVFLIDACPEPVNDRSQAARRAALKQHAPECLRRVRELEPFGVIVCHKPTFLALREQFDGLLLHSLRTGSWDTAPMKSATGMQSVSLMLLL